jgi:uncharacterized protein (DUF1778 family)
MASTVRDSRLEFRLASDEKAIIERAAALSGSNTTDFVRSTMLTAAKEAVQRFATPSLVKGHSLSEG